MKTEAIKQQFKDESKYHRKRQITAEDITSAADIDRGYAQPGPYQRSSHSYGEIHRQI